METSNNRKMNATITARIFEIGEVVSLKKEGRVSNLKQRRYLQELKKVLGGRGPFRVIKIEEVSEKNKHPQLIHLGDFCKRPVKVSYKYGHGEGFRISGAWLSRF